MAMGAMPASVLRMILRQGSLPSVAGIALGVIASAAAGALIQAAIPGTGGDAFTYMLIVPAVIVVLMLAAYIPARRAAHIDPLGALRQDWRSLLKHLRAARRNESAKVRRCSAMVRRSESRPPPPTQVSPGCRDPSPNAVSWTRILQEGQP